MQVVRGVTIDASVSEARLTEVLTAPAGPDWGSINVHLTEDLLSAAQRRRLGECIIKEIEVPFPSAELMRTLNKLGNAVDRGQAAEAMLRAVPPPRTVVTRADDVALHVVLNWPSEPFASPGASMVRCVGVTEIRVNGRAIRPKSPAGRFLTRLTPTSLALELGEGDAIDGVLEIEVDLAWAVLRDPPPHVVDWQLPGGPIELLPHAIAIRRQTLSQRVPAR